MKELCFVLKVGMKILGKTLNYFFNFENRNYNNKVMNKLVNKNGEDFL